MVIANLANIIVIHFKNSCNFDITWNIEEFANLTYTFSNFLNIFYPIIDTCTSYLYGTFILLFYFVLIKKLLLCS